MAGFRADRDRPPTWSKRDSVTVLGAISHDKETFHYWFEERLTAQHGIAYLRSLVDEFGENIVVLLDLAPIERARLAGRD